MQPPFAGFPVAGACGIGTTPTIAGALRSSERIASCALLPSTATVACLVLLVRTIVHRFTRPRVADQVLRPASEVVLVTRRPARRSGLGCTPKTVGQVREPVGCAPQIGRGCLPRRHIRCPYPVRCPLVRGHLMPCGHLTGVYHLPSTIRCPKFEGT